MVCTLVSVTFPLPKTVGKIEGRQKAQQPQGHLGSTINLACKVWGLRAPTTLGYSLCTTFGSLGSPCVQMQTHPTGKVNSDSSLCCTRLQYAHVLRTVSEVHLSSLLCSLAGQSASHINLHGLSQAPRIQCLRRGHDDCM